LQQQRDEELLSFVGCGRVARWFIFNPKNPNLGKFLRVIDWKLFIYFMAIWNVWMAFWIFYEHMVHLVFIWYIFSCFGIMYQEKSGSLGLRRFRMKKRMQKWFFLPNISTNKTF
jgi:hypothetical protein